MAPAYEALGCEVEIVSSRDLEAVLRACEAADLVSVHSPPFQHLDHVLAAVNAGKAVLCDKPFGRSADDARAMLDAAEQAGVPHFVNFEFRANPGRAKVKDLLDSGAIGTPRHIQYSGFSNYMALRRYGWLNDARLGGGWLGALGSHIVDTVRWQLGSEVTSCGGLSRVDIPMRDDGQGGLAECTAEDAFSIWLAFDSGATATIEAASSGAVALPQRMTVIGSEGTIELVEENIVTVTRPKAEAETFDMTPTPVGQVWPAIRAWLGQVIEAVQDGRSTSPDFSDGLATAIVLTELKRKMVRVMPRT